MISVALRVWTVQFVVPLSRRLQVVRCYGSRVVLPLYSSAIRRVNRWVCWLSQRPGSSSRKRVALSICGDGKHKP